MGVINLFAHRNRDRGMSSHTQHQVVAFFRRRVPSPRARKRLQWLFAPWKASASLAAGIAWQGIIHFKPLIWLGVIA